MPLNIVGAELSAGGLPGAGGIVFLLLAFQLIPDLGIFQRKMWGGVGIVNSGIFSLRQKIFKGKIIFLVRCFRRTIKTVFSYVPPGFLGWGGHAGAGRGSSCPLVSPGSGKKRCRTSP